MNKSRVRSNIHLQREGGKPESQNVSQVVISVSDREAQVIAEYAQMCGETMEDIVRKSIIREATLADASEPDDTRYRYRIVMPLELSPKQEMRLLAAKYNKIRALLGWEPINL